MKLWNLRIEIVEPVMAENEEEARTLFYDIIRDASIYYSIMDAQISPMRLTYEEEDVFVYHKGEDSITLKQALELCPESKKEIEDYTEGLKKQLPKNG